ncbi:MAG: NAD(P)H-hydrate dehydratase [Planctomycetota bacterium]
MNDSLRLPVRPRDAHKGDLGRLVLVAGSRRWAGAAVLAAEGAQRAGVGLATLAAPGAALVRLGALDPGVMVVALASTREGTLGEAGLRALRVAVRGADAVAVGPGLGRDPAMRDLLTRALRDFPGAVVVDADALDAFAGAPEELAALGARRFLTPHPGEAARLLGCTVADVAADREGTALELARRSEGIAILKGPRTVVADPTGAVTLGPEGDPVLARGGSGDVLTGVLGALAARGLDPRLAARVAVAAHARAGERLAAREGRAGPGPRDLAAEIGRVLGELEGAEGDAS